MKRLTSIAVSAGILALIYWRIDSRALLVALSSSDLAWLVVSLGMVVPLTLATAARLRLMAPADARISFGEANSLILAASSLNMVLPSKMGDIAKAYFIRERGGISGPLSLSLVVFEKACDMLALLFWCALGLVVHPSRDWFFWVLTLTVLFGLAVLATLLGSNTAAQYLFRAATAVAPGRFSHLPAALADSWRRMHEYFWSDRDRLAGTAMMSLLIWFLHLMQIWFFILALRATTPLIANLALAPLAILAGLLPFTFAGVGTRDAALVLLYQPFLTAPTAAALGILCTSRYLLPALAGLPFLSRYMTGPSARDRSFTGLDR